MKMDLLFECMNAFGPFSLSGMVSWLHLPSGNDQQEGPEHLSFIPAH